MWMWLLSKGVPKDLKRTETVILVTTDTVSGGLNECPSSLATYSPQAIISESVCSLVYPDPATSPPWHELNERHDEGYDWGLSIPKGDRGQRHRCCTLGTIGRDENQAIMALLHTSIWLAALPGPWEGRPSIWLGRLGQGSQLEREGHVPL